MKEENKNGDLWEAGAQPGRTMTVGHSVPVGMLFGILGIRI